MNIKNARFPSKVLKQPYVSEEPWSLSFIQFLKNPPQTSCKLNAGENIILTYKHPSNILYRW